MQAQPVSSSRKRKFLLWGLGITAAGIAGYFGWQYLRKRKAGSETISPSYYEPSPASAPAQNTKPKASSVPARNDSFPLRKGSKGDNVRALQQALIAKHGASILPKYGADGDFGSETVSALAKAGLPAEISETTFRVLTSSASVDATTTANTLLAAARAKDFNKALAALKTLRSKDDYIDVGNKFKAEDLRNGRKYTLVTGMLETFTTASQKDAIRLEFARMGLIERNGIWSLEGLEGLPVMTLQPTQVWRDARTAISVPARYILGKALARRNAYLVFENSGRPFLVKADSVCYL